MHSQNPPMIHRDVKPPNILIERGTLHVYMTDMGLARIKMGRATMTQVGMIGTAYYAAPETFQGAAGTASDVWAFGMVLLELYGERHAWGDVKSQHHLLGKIMTKQLPYIGHLDESRQNICKACLNYDPKARKSVPEVLQLLRTTE
ncbi:uncharacterized protein [Dysidea avara]|uniref:uncharacterized protein n=1 Tax=Dysidea avara TaxID=196820 RepID=UPI00331733EF